MADIVEQDKLPRPELAQYSACAPGDEFFMLALYDHDWHVDPREIVRGIVGLRPAALESTASTKSLKPSGVADNRA